jgi:hypothetical protein
MSADGTWGRVAGAEARPENGSEPLPGLGSEEMAVSKSHVSSNKRTGHPVM